MSKMQAIILADPAVFSQHRSLYRANFPDSRYASEYPATPCVDTLASVLNTLLR
jgi:hypothetical protein